MIVNLYPICYGDTALQSNAHFPAQFRQKKFPHPLNWTRFAKIIGAKRLGKCASTSHSSMDKRTEKINSDRTPLCTHRI